MRIRGLWWVIALALAGAAVAQDGDDDSGLEIGDGTVPPPEEEEEAGAPAAEEGGAGAEDRGPQTLELAHGFRITLPGDWRVRRMDDPKALLLADVRFPRARGDARLVVYHEPRMGGAPAGQRLFVEQFRKEFGTAASRAHDPLPQVEAMNPTVEFDAVGWVAFPAFQGLYVRVDAARRDFERNKEAILAAVASIETTAKHWPPVPADYETKSKGGFVWAIHPSFDGSLRDVQRLLKQQEKRFRRVHGRLPKAPRGREPVIFVHARGSDGARLANDRADAYFADFYSGRMFVTPVAKTDPEHWPLLAGEIQRFFFLQRYGDEFPLWVFQGERQVARAETFTGKKLPTLHAGMANWRRNLSLYPLPKIDELRTLKSKSYSPTCFFYMCLFHAGPAKYRKAYKAFLADLAETGDAAGAQERHLAPLGYAEIQRDATTFMHKIEAYTPRK